MAVRNNFAAGEVLAAADLNDTFAAKWGYVRQSSAPTGAYGVQWEDTSTTPSKVKIWNGSAWVVFSGGWSATFNEGASSGGTWFSQTNPLGDGVNYRGVYFTSNGTLAIATSGLAEVLIVGGGAAGWSSFGNTGGGGDIIDGWWKLSAGSLSVTIGAGGTFSSNTTTASGKPSSIGALACCTTWPDINGQGRGATSGSRTTGYTSIISGSSYVYSPSANPAQWGGGGNYPSSSNGTQGIVFVRVPV